MSNYGVLTHAHNSVIINGIEGILSRRDHRIPEFWDAETHIAVEHGPDYCEIHLSHNGFVCHGNGVGVFTRSILLTESQLKISDSVHGFGQVLFEAFFQLPKLPANLSTDYTKNIVPTLPGSYGEDDFTFEASFAPENTHFYVGGAVDALAGWRFTAFGEKQPAVTIKLASKVSLPFQSTYEFSMVTK